MQPEMIMRVCVVYPDGVEKEVIESHSQKIISQIQEREQSFFVPDDCLEYLREAWEKGAPMPSTWYVLEFIHLKALCVKTLFWQAQKEIDETFGNQKTCGTIGAQRDDLN